MKIKTIPIKMTKIKNLITPNAADVTAKLDHSYRHC